MNLKNTFLLYIIGLSLISCQPDSELSKDFSCSNSSFSDMETVHEFQNNFSVKLPKNWKTELYSITNQSGIISADTTKVFSESYKIDFSIATGNIELPEDLHQKINTLIQRKNLKEIKNSFHKFKGKPAYAHLSLGKQNEVPFNIFQYYIKINDEKYILVKVEIYGTENREQRLCEAISLINKIQIIKSE